MKRPSAWPLLVILMVVAVVFVLLWFESRLEKREVQLVTLDEQLTQRGLETQSLRQQVEALKAQLDQANASLEALKHTDVEPLTSQVTSLEAKVRTLEAVPSQEANPSNALADTVLWTLSMSAFFLVILEFILQ